ncbi:MAG: hypothetical protein ACE5NA_05655 [Nitrospiraceae bacterium]
MREVSCESNSEMMAMMSEIMEGCGPQMMMDMMPHCVGMVVQKVPSEKRTEFVLKLVGTLVERGSTGMSEQEKREFFAKVAERVK